MNKEWLTAQEAGKLVRFDSLRKGDVVLTAYSGVVVYERANGANHGAHHARRASDNAELVFAGCADVLVNPQQGVA